MQQQLPQPIHSKIHISDLHESITEEILWQRFKEFGTISNVRVFRDNETKRSRGYAKVAFKDPSSADKAREKLNFTHLIDSDVAGQKQIKVSRDINRDDLESLKKHNVFIRGIPKSLKPKELYNYLTCFGEIQSLHIAQKKTYENVGYGFVLFRNEADNIKLVKQSQEDKKEFKVEGSNLEFFQFQNQSERTVKQNNFYLKDFCKTKFDEKMTKDEQEKQQALIEEEKKKLQEKLSVYGKISSIIINHDKKTGLLSSLCCFEDADGSAKLLEAYGKGIEGIGFVNKIEKAIKSSTSENRFFSIKNLKFYEDEKEQEAFKALCKEVFGTFGNVIHFDLQKGVKPQTSRDLQNSCHAVLILETEKQGIEFLMTYLKSDKVSKLFLNENSNGNVTICMPKKERKRMIQSSTKSYRNNQQTFQQSMSMGALPVYPMQQQQPFQQAQFQRMGQVGNQGFKRTGYQNRGGNNQMRGGQGFNQFNNGGQQRQQNFGQNNQNRQHNQQSKSAPRAFNGNQNNQQQQQQQPAVAQQQAASGETPQLGLEDLKQNLEKFTKLDSTKQSQILGNLIFPKVRDLVKEQNEAEALAPKITGMLIDFTVFDVADIIDILENDAELKERVKEAIELIKQQN